MDTSETYVKMCDCGEVQGQYKIVYDATMHITGDSHDYVKHQIRQVEGINRGVSVWLPRQDQIQEMMEITGASDFELAVYDMFFEDDGYHHCNVTPAWRTENITTVEQLWLAFYMSEKHGRRWSGSEWVASS